jgi:hypothetical protein
MSSAASVHTIDTRCNAIGRASLSLEARNRATGALAYTIAHSHVSNVADSSGSRTCTGRSSRARTQPRLYPPITRGIILPKCRRVSQQRVYGEDMYHIPVNVGNAERKASNIWCVTVLTRLLLKAENLDVELPRRKAIHDPTEKPTLVPLPCFGPRGNLQGVLRHCSNSKL